MRTFLGGLGKGPASVRVTSAGDLVDAVSGQRVRVHAVILSGTTADAQVHFGSSPAAGNVVVEGVWASGGGPLVCVFDDVKPEGDVNEKLAVTGTFDACVVFYQMAPDNE